MMNECDDASRVLNDDGERKRREIIIEIKGRKDSRAREHQN